MRPWALPQHQCALPTNESLPAVVLVRSGRHVVEEKLWPLCEAAGVSLLWLPARSPWFNPIEKFNGWLKDRVADAIQYETIDHSDLARAVYATLDQEEVSRVLVKNCRGWIDFLFAPQKLEDYRAQ